MSGTLTIKVEDAARLLGVAPQRVRGKIRRGEWKFGEFYPCETINRWTRKPHRTTYVIFAPKLAEHVGLTLEELRREVAALDG